MLILDSILFVVTIVPIAVIATWSYRWLKKGGVKGIVSKRKISPKNYPAGRVVMFHMGASAWCPSASPFVMKVMTYLRMTNTPHQYDDAVNNPSKKGKFPWIIYNGLEVEDSSVILEHLNKVRGQDLNGHLDPKEKAVARAFQKLIEEELYWIVQLHRHGPKTPDSLLKTMVPGLPLPVLQYARYVVQQNAYAHGIGRHTAEELDSMLRKDLRALSEYMGDSKFLMGDDVSEVDCVLFGLLAQIKWQMPGSTLEDVLLDYYGNLSRYCDRMKEAHFQDWDDLITHGGTREPNYKEL